MRRARAPLACARCWGRIAGEPIIARLYLLTCGVRVCGRKKMDIPLTERRHPLTSAFLVQLMSRSHRDIRALESALREGERPIGDIRALESALLEDSREIMRDMENEHLHITTNYGPLGLRGTENRKQTVAELRTRMDALEDEMENACIDEGTYLERADALKHEYTQATQNRELLATLAAETVRMLRRVQSVPHLVTQGHEAFDAEEVN